MKGADECRYNFSKMLLPVQIYTHYTQVTVSRYPGSHVWAVRCSGQWPLFSPRPGEGKSPEIRGSNGRDWTQGQGTTLHLHQAAALPQTLIIPGQARPIQPFWPGRPETRRDLTWACWGLRVLGAVLLACTMYPCTPVPIPPPPLCTLCTSRALSPPIPEDNILVPEVSRPHYNLQRSRLLLDCNTSLVLLVVRLAIVCACFIATYSLFLPVHCSPSPLGFSNISLLVALHGPASKHPPARSSISGPLDIDSHPQGSPYICQRPNSSYLRYRN